MAVEEALRERTLLTSLECSLTSSKCLRPTDPWHLSPLQCPLCLACPEAFLSLSSPGDSLRYTANTISSVFCSVWCFLWTVCWAGIPYLMGWAVLLPRGAQHARFRRDLREHPALLVLHLWKRKFRAQVTWLWPHSKGDNRVWLLDSQSGGMKVISLVLTVLGGI